MKVEASAPIRICDLGGWTDTWFAESGVVLNIAVTPRIRVTATLGRGAPTQDRLIDAAIARWCPALPVSVLVESPVPPGSSTGTSASLCVALAGALRTLAGNPPSKVEAAQEAWSLEYEDLRRQSGVQDQFAAAFGGVSLLAVDAFPAAKRQSVNEPEGLEDALSLVYLGQPHDSSDVHFNVIRRLKAGGDRAVLDALRDYATEGYRCLESNDLPGFGQAMVGNTEAQRLLDPAMIGVEAQAVIDLAKSTGAQGWKVNGAGGAGGSVTALHLDPSRREAFRAEVLHRPPWRLIPLQVDHQGLVVLKIDS